MGVERSGASVWDDAERRCELSFRMGNGEFPISARYGCTTLYGEYRALTPVLYRSLVFSRWTDTSVAVIPLRCNTIDLCIYLRYWYLLTAQNMVYSKYLEGVNQGLQISDKVDIAIKIV